MKNRGTICFAALLLVLSVMIPFTGGKETQAEENEYDMILPESDRRFYAEEELEDMPAQVMLYARNEIYARHGRIFRNQELREYFELQSWYYGKIKPEDFSNEILNEYELENARMLVILENQYMDRKYRLNQDNYSFDEIDRYVSSRKNRQIEEYNGIAKDLDYDEELRTLRTRYLELDLPSEWEDHFGISNPSEKELAFYCKLAHQQDGVYDGMICSIYMTEEYEPEENFLDAVYLGECNGKYFYFMHPVDERYAPEDEEGTALYKEMRESTDEIIETIRLIP